MPQIRRALISVYDKTGVVEFARALHGEFGIEIISTGGTAKTLQDAGIPVTLVESITGFPEMLDGRVKTLHPKIHAAILADRDNPEHMRQLEEQGIKPIDLVVVDLYPFEETIANPDCTFEQAIEMIDIGGPCLLRAAAKNHKHVLVLSHPEDRLNVLVWLREDTLSDYGWACVRRDYARAVYQLVSQYDATVTSYLATTQKLRFWSLFGYAVDALRYGENPHQSAHLCELAGQGELGFEWSPHIEGPALSFNNWVDATAARELCAELTRAARGPKVWHRLTAGGEKVCPPRVCPPKVWHRLIAGGQQPQASTKQHRQTIDDEVNSRRNLPHIQRPGATYFITFCIREGTLAPEERDLVLDCCLYPDGKQACVHEVVVMPDHVHLLLTPLEIAPGEVVSLSEILHSIKGNAGRRVADRRGHGSGPVWQDESFDHILRNEREFWETLEYMYTNPERSGLGDPDGYAWLAYEEEPGWDTESHAAVVDLQHALYQHRLLAGATPSGATPSLHRLLAGATLAGATLGRAAPGGATPPGTTRPATAHACVCFIKHTNACGAAVDRDPVEAYRRAYLGDPNAAMGGILAVNFAVTPEFAAAVMGTYQRWGKAAGAGGFFLEVWLAPSFDDEAIRIIRGEVEGKSKKDWGQRVRLLAVGDMSTLPDPNEMDYKRIAGGVLMQTRDLVGLDEGQWRVVTEKKPTDSEWDDLRLAWLVCKHTKSNAISLCRDGMLIGNGAGQMTRVMSCRIATWLAKENGHADKLSGAVAASDGFFPFRDGPDLLADAGVTAIIQPGGSKQDQKVIEACNERGVAMVFTGTRHFKH